VFIAKKLNKGFQVLLSSIVFTVLSAVVAQAGGGMLHIETIGGKSKSGTFILPGDDQTLLVHCDMAQHIVRGQLVVGADSGDLWGVGGAVISFTVPFTCQHRQ